MPQTYAITAPNGKTLEITGDHVPTEAELHDIFANAGVDTAPAATSLPDVSAHAGVPARGRGTQLDLDKSNRGVALATTPLAHPTGIDAIDGFTSPVGLASLAAGGVGIARAGMAGGVTAAAKTAIADASPLIKYEATKTALEKIGLPSPLAIAAAIAVSGYKKPGKAAPAGPPSTAAPAGVETAQDALARRMASPPTAAPVAAEAAPAVEAAAPAVAPAAASTPAAATEFEAARAIRMGPDGKLVGRPGGNPALPDQKALNDAAIAAKRVAYQASLQPDADAVVKASGKLHFTAPEWAAFRELRARGVGLEEAATGARAAGQLARQFGLSQPTAAQTSFPKGNRR